MACTKEKILKKNDFPDKGEIFMVGYINNLNGKVVNNGIRNQIITNLGISIYGKNIVNMGISLYLDTGIGFEKLPIFYVSKYFQYDCELSLFRFIEEKKYSFKLVSERLKDSIIIEKYLPNYFKLISNQYYDSKNEFNTTIKIIDNDNIKNYIYDCFTIKPEFPDTFKVKPFGPARYYKGTELPNLIGNVNEIQTYSEILNNNGYSVNDEVRIPFIVDKCSYISLKDFDFIYEMYKFSKNDFDYITSIHNNIINYGNPFFLNYQIKNIEKSKSEKIFGFIVSSNIQRSDIYKIRDYSDKLIKIYIKDVNGSDIIGNPNYYIFSGGGSGKLEYKKSNTLNYFYISENELLRKLTDCSNYLYDKNFKFGFQFKIKNNLTGKTNLTNEVLTDLNNLPKDIIFTLR